MPGEVGDVGAFVSDVETSQVMHLRQWAPQLQGEPERGSLCVAARVDERGVWAFPTTEEGREAVRVALDETSESALVATAGRVNEISFFGSPSIPGCC